MISAFGVEHGEISKSLKPRHLKAMDDYFKTYQADPVKHAGRYNQVRQNTYRSTAAMAGKKAATYNDDWVRAPLVNNGKRNMGVVRDMKKEQSRKYRKNTRMGLFRTEIGEKVQ